MKLIVMSGKGYKFKKDDFVFLNNLPNVQEVIMTDYNIYITRWARSKNIIIKIFNIEYQRLGRNAGALRNKQLVKYGNSVIIFPGYKNTSNIRFEAKKANIIIYDKSKKI